MTHHHHRDRGRDRGRDRAGGRDRHWHRHRRVNAWMYRRYLRRYSGDELRALEEYRRDIEQHLEDVSERIRRLRAGADPAGADSAGADAAG